VPKEELCCQRKQFGARGRTIVLEEDFRHQEELWCQRRNFGAGGGF